jgi:hypothetical protein
VGVDFLASEADITGRILHGWVSIQGQDFSVCCHVKTQDQLFFPIK